MEIKINLLDIEKDIEFFYRFKEALIKEVEAPKDFKDVEERVLSEKVDSIYKNMELSFLFSELIFKINFIKEYGATLTENIKEFYNTHANQMYVRNFSIEETGIVESRKGFLVEKREEFLNSPFFKDLKYQLETSSQ